MKLYVGNLPWSIDDEGLKTLFSSYEVSEANVLKDKFNGKSKGFGFVVIENDESAKKAIEELNGKEVEGREIRVNEAQPFDPDKPKRKKFQNKQRNFNKRY